YEAGYTPSVKFDSEGLTVSPLREEFMANTADQKVGYFLDNAAPGMFDVLTKTSQEVMLGELTPEQAWEQMTDRYEQAVRDAQARSLLTGREKSAPFMDGAGCPKRC